MISILQLPIGVPYLMIGGWGGSSGHGMLYEFIRQEEGFELRIFNTGSGTENHLQMVEGTKQKIVPVLLKKSIPASALSLAFFQALLEPQILPYWENRAATTLENYEITKVNPSQENCKKLIYQAFFQLEGELQDPSSMGFMTAQRAGTCSCSTLFAYLRYRAGANLGLFEQIQLWLRLGTLTQGWESWKGEIDKKSYLLSLLERGAQRILSHSVKPTYIDHGKPWFSTDEIQVAQSLGSNVLFNLAKCRAETKSAAKKEVEGISWNLPIHLNRDHFLYRPFLKNFDKEIPCFPLDKSPQLTDPSICSRYLQKKLAAIQVESTSNYPSEIKAQLQWLIESLPIPTQNAEDFWKKIPEDQLHACSEALNTILIMYFQRFQEETLAVLPEEQNVFFAILTMLHTLALRVEKNQSVSLNDYRIGDPTKLQEKDPNIVFFSPSSLARRQQIIQYFSEYNNHHCEKSFLHDFSSSFSDFPGDTQGFTEELRKRDEFQHYLRLIRYNAITETPAITPSMELSYFICLERNAFLMDLNPIEKQAFLTMLDPFQALQKSGHSSLAYLHQAALVAHIAGGNWKSKKGTRGEDCQIKCTLTHDFGPVKRMIYFFQIGEKQYFVEQTPSDRWRSVFSHTKNPTAFKIRKEPEHALRPMLRSEGAALPSMELRNIEEPKARPIHILGAASHAISSFKDPKERISFLIDFFRSDLVSHELRTHLKELCLQPEFLKRCEEFILKGINYYWNFPRKNDRDLTSTLFFIRVALNLKSWIPQNVQSSQTFSDEYIRQFLRDLFNEETQTDKTDINFHLLLSYINQQSFAENEIEEVLLSWFGLDRHFASKDSLDFHSITQVQHFVWGKLAAISEILERSPDLCQKVAQSIWKGKGNSKILKWSYDKRNRVFLASSNGKAIALDLQSRAIKIDGKDYYTSNYVSDEMLKVPGFKRVFKDRTPSKIQCTAGQSSFFTDPIWGEIEIREAYVGQPRIIRKDENGKKYYFCSDLSTVEAFIPLAIRSQAILWIPCSTSDTFFDNLWSLSDPDTGKELYRLDPNLCLSQESRHLISTPSVFYRLEGKGAVLSWMNRDGKKVIEYPFMQSRNREILRFDVNLSEEISWRENPEYILTDQENGLLGTSSQYLLLRNQNSHKRKILVPMGPLYKKSVLSSHSALSRTFGFEDVSGILTINQIEQDPKIDFFAFDIENDEPVGRTPLENLYLSYLFLSQRDYKSALNYFEKIENKNRFTKEEWQDLLQVIKWLTNLNDRTPEASAILLKAWTLVCREIRHPDVRIPQELPKNLQTIYAEYLEDTNHRSSLFELTTIEEDELRKRFSNEKRSSARKVENPNFIAPVSRTLPSVDLFNSYKYDLSSFSFFSPKKLQNLYFLSEINCNEFQPYYDWIRWSTPEERKYLASVLSYHILAKGAETFFKLLYLACHVERPSLLPDIGDDNTEEIKNAIFTKTGVKNLGGQPSFPPHSENPPPAPLHHLKLETQSPPVQDDRMIALPFRDIPKVDLGPVYFEKLLSGFYQLKKETTLDSLKKQLLEEEKKIEEKLSALEDKILATAYGESQELRTRRKEQAAILSGHFVFSITLSSLIGLFLEGTYGGFLQALPRCSMHEIDLLNQDLQTFLIESCYLQQLKRSRNLIKHSLNPEEEHLLGLEIHAECSYPPNFRPGLVFEYVSNKRLRPLQASQLQEIVHRMDSDNPFLLTHMIMGGGKTDVFASLLGRLWAKKDQLSLFLTPVSQLKTVQGNLASSQWRCFKQGICTFDYNRHELTLDVLKDIQQELIEAIDTKRLVVLRAEMPQILELEFATLVCATTKNDKKIQVLKNILNILRKKTAVIIDEADEVLRTDKETNFPSGEKLPLDSQYISLIAIIYRILAVDLKDLPVKEQLLQLPAVLSVNPFFAEIPVEYRESFQRYLEGIIDPKLEKVYRAQTEDKKFLVWRDRIAKTDLKTAHLMALARHVIQEILPHTLHKTTRRDYGRASIDSGKVVPYIAAGIPAITEFGHPWELVAYHFQTALSSDMSSELFSHIVELFVAIAKEESLIWNCPLHKTPIFHEVQEHLGISILDMQDVAVKQEFLKKVNADIEKKFYLEEKLIQREVRYDPNYFSSNSHNLLMFPKALAMTGTPYNRGAYPKNLSIAPILDLESVNALTELLGKRNGEIHAVSEISNLEKTLSQVLKRSQASKHLRAIIDIGGCLLTKSNEEYAKEILTIFEKDPSVQGVIFFKESSRISLWKKGEAEAIDVVDTHPDTWKALGINPNRLFFFYDHLHSRGTDFPLPSKTVALTLLKPEDQIHQILQGVARCRKLTSSQDVIYALDESAMKAIQEEEKKLDIQTLLQRSMLLEKDALRLQIYRHYIQEINHVVRSFHLDELLEENSKTQADPNLLRISHPNSPYHEFGKLQAQISPIVGIENHAKMILDQYRYRYPKAVTIIQSIVEDAKAHLIDLPHSVQEKNLDLSREKHLQKEVQMQKENERLTHFESEWLYYQTRPRIEKESSWTKDEADSLVGQKGQILNHSQCKKISPLKALLRDYSYRHPYPGVFTDNLYATKNWHQNALPIFSTYHKPALQMLMIEHGPKEEKKISGILLSLAE
ncbi:MAG TPA: DUF3638 domain-containing protein, partial [Chlamydiales bacterium]|nr:DUF3638 domain-containing protein [Chlamydiales bacterium]